MTEENTNASATAESTEPTPAKKTRRTTNPDAPKRRPRKPVVERAENGTESAPSAQTPSAEIEIHKEAVKQVENIAEVTPVAAPKPAAGAPENTLTQPAAAPVPAAAPAPEPPAREAQRPPAEPPVFAEGIVEVSGKGFGFLRELRRNFSQSNNDVFVTPEVVRKHGLRDGMWIKGETRRGGRGPQLYKLLEIEARIPTISKTCPSSRN